MPASVPYFHSSLVLGNIVDPELLNMLQQIAAAQGKIDAAQAKLNSLISMKRSLSMTLSDLAGMNVPVTSLIQKIKEIDKRILTAASAYVDTRLQEEETIQSVQEKISDATTTGIAESPLDYEQSVIRQFPLSADSLSLDAQYFSYGTNEETDPAAKIENYIKEATAPLGAKTSGDIARTAGAQVSMQRQKHSLAGTLIITASCTHRKASIISPLVLDAEKAIDSWNQLFPNATIDTGSPEKLLQENGNTGSGASTETIHMISGVALGSGFVGMVHVLNTDSIRERSSDLNTLAGSMQERLTLGGWIEEASGGIGVDPSMVNEVRSLLSDQNISSHVSMVVMGALPSIKSNDIKMAVKSFADREPSRLRAEVAALNPEKKGKQSVKSAAAEAKNAGRMLKVQSAQTQSVIKGLAEIDHQTNKVLDINSLMTAFENYLEAIRSGDSGVPIQFYLKQISRDKLIDDWKAKYKSDRLLSINGENTPTENGGKADKKKGN